MAEHVSIVRRPADSKRVGWIVGPPDSFAVTIHYVLRTVTVLPFVLIGLSAVSHATWNLAVKWVGDAGAPFVWAYSLVGSLVYAPVALVWMVTDHEALSGKALGAIAISAVGQMAYCLLLQKAYATGDLSVIYPVTRGIGQLLVVVFAIVWLAERPGWSGMMGALFVCAGVFIVGSSRVLTPGGDGARWADVGLGLCAGLLVASCNLWDVRTVSVLAVSPVMLEWIFNISRVAVLAPMAMARRDRLVEIWHGHKASTLVVGVLSPLSYILALWAFHLGPISLVAPVRELSVVFAAAGAWLLFREAQPSRKLVGALVIVAGVTALTMSNS